MTDINKDNLYLLTLSHFRDFIVNVPHGHL